MATPLIVTPGAPPPASPVTFATSKLPGIPAGADARLDQIRGVFDDHEKRIYKHRWAVQLHVSRLVGGTPTDQNITEGWIRTKMGLTSAEAVTAAVEEVMKARPQLSVDAALEEVAKQRNLSGFKRNFNTPIALRVQQLAVERGVKVLNRDGKTHTLRKFSETQAQELFGELLIEGRQIKAMIKEAAMIAVGAGHIDGKGWGSTRKSMLGFLAEHAFVPEDEVLLGVTDPSEVNQSFVHTFRGSGIKLEEIIHDAVVDFTLQCDYDFAAKEKDFFATVFVVAQQNGLGASRSQGFGRFKVTKFDKLS